MNRFLTPLFAPGFFVSGPVHTALILGTSVALVSGAVGVFAVVRGQAFAGEALSDIGAGGGSAALLINTGALWGFLSAVIGAAAVMELIGVQRPRGRDLATGIVLGTSLGIAALILYFVTTYHSTTGATVTILFGSLFSVDPSLIAPSVVLAVVAVALVCLIQRPLLLSSLSPDLAEVRGIPVRLIGALYLLALAVAVALSALTIGAILGTALLIGPAATALRLSRHPGPAMLAAGAIGALATWVGIVLAYDSYLWPPRGNGWPVSFFVVAAILIIYIFSGLPGLWRRGRGQRVS